MTRETAMRALNAIRKYYGMPEQELTVLITTKTGSTFCCGIRAIDMELGYVELRMDDTISFIAYDSIESITGTDDIANL